MVDFNMIREIVVEANRRREERELILQEQKGNLKYLSEVFEEIGFIIDSVEVNSRFMYEPIVKFVNHRKNVKKFNDLLSLMGLTQFKMTPIGKIFKREKVRRPVSDRDGNRRNRYEYRRLNVKPADLKLLADLLMSRRDQIVTYLKVIKELKI